MAGWRPIFRALHFCPLLCSGPLGAGAWLACRTVRICAWRFGFTSTFCSSSLRRREPKRKEAHGHRLSFHPYAFYLFVKVLSLYDVASWKNANLMSTSENVCHLATSSSPRLSQFARSTTLKFCGLFTLVFRKENLMARCGGCAERDKNRNGTLCLPRSS